MVMIDLVAEKQSLGFSSVTQVTEALLVGYLPYTRPGTYEQVRWYVKGVPQAWADQPTCRVPKENMSNRAEAPSLVGGFKGA